MTDGASEYTVPFSLRLTRAQRLKLSEDAGSLPMGEYVRSCLFERRPALKRTFRRPVRDEQALMQVLGALGQSRLSSNLNQLAKALHSGSLPLTPETERLLIQACADVAAMRTALVQSLGLDP